MFNYWEGWWALPSEKSLSILVVDDDEDLSEALSEYLQSSGFKVTIAGSYKKAAEILSWRHSGPDMLLADLRLPDGDGLQVIKMAKEINGDILSAVMTGYASLETALEAIRVGAYDYVTKPFSLREIEILVRNMSDKILLVRQNREANQKLKHFYARIDSLQEDKVALIRLNREMRREFEKLSQKLDRVLHLLKVMSDPRFTEGLHTFHRSADN